MKNYRIEVKWALVFMAMMLIWMLIEKMAGLHSTHIDKHVIYTNFVAIPAIAVYVFAMLDKKRNFYDGTMSYKQGFVFGLIMTFKSCYPKHHIPNHYPRIFSQCYQICSEYRRNDPNRSRGLFQLGKIHYSGHNRSVCHGVDNHCHCRVFCQKQSYFHQLTPIFGCNIA